MRCSNCGTENNNSNKFCEECGLPLQQERKNTQKALQVATASGIALGNEARRLRLEADYSGEEIISDRLYNLIMGGVVLWGFLINVIICAVADTSLIDTNPIVFLLIYVVMCFAGVRIAAKSKNPWMSFLGYNMVVLPIGYLLAYCVQYYLGLNPQIVTAAFLYTLLITVGMVGAALAFPSLFDKIGGMLLGILIGLIVCELIMLLLGFGNTVTNILFAGLFSIYIGYDIHRAQKFAKTVDNAVDCALDLYLDIINLFLRILQILAKSKSKD